MCRAETFICGIFFSPVCDGSRGEPRCCSRWLPVWHKLACSDFTCSSREIIHNWEFMKNESNASLFQEPAWLQVSARLSAHPDCHQRSDQSKHYLRFHTTLSGNFPCILSLGSSSAHRLWQYSLNIAQIPVSDLLCTPRYHADHEFFIRRQQLRPWLSRKCRSLMPNQQPCCNPTTQRNISWLLALLYTCGDAALAKVVMLKIPCRWQVLSVLPDM